MIEKIFKTYPHSSPDLALWLTLSGSIHPCLKQISMVPKKSDCSYMNNVHNFDMIWKSVADEVDDQTRRDMCNLELIRTEAGVSRTQTQFNPHTVFFFSVDHSKKVPHLELLVCLLVVVNAPFCFPIVCSIYLLSVSQKGSAL